MIADKDRDGKLLYSSDNHQVIWLGIDSEEEKGVIQANQYLIIHNGKGILFDPGGVHLFARVVAVVSRYIELDNITTIVFSHQDPDVSSGIALWMGITEADIYISELWIRFLPHFGIVDLKRIIPIEQNMPGLFSGSGSELLFIPSHFLHSAGNFSFFDKESGILFSGDIGAAVFDSNFEYLIVDDFDEHLKLIEGFHRRYMTSSKAASAWAASVRSLSPDMIAPQHGSIYRGGNAVKFLNWFAGLKCGIDMIEEFYS